MGGNLTAFRNQNEAEEMQKAKGGKIYGWEALLTFYEKGELSMD